MGNITNVERAKREEMQARTDALVAIVHSKKRRVSQYDVKILNFLIKGFGIEIMESLIPQAMGLEWTNPTAWQHLATVYKRHPIPKVEAALRHVSSYRFPSVAAVEQYLAAPKSVSAIGNPIGPMTRPLVAARPALPANAMYSAGAFGWIVKKFGTPSQEYLHEYFDSAWSTEHNSTLYYLKPEYR